jgi:hypothetical protein
MNDRLRGANLHRDEPALITLLLGALPSAYDTTVQIIENMPQLPTITEVLGKLMTHDKRLTKSEGAHAFVSFNRPQQQQLQRRPWQQQQTQQGMRDPRECHYCHKPGHLMFECRKRLADQAAERNGNRFSSRRGGGRGGNRSSGFRPNGGYNRNNSGSRNPNGNSRGNGRGNHNNGRVVALTAVTDEDMAFYDSFDSCTDDCNSGSSPSNGNTGNTLSRADSSSNWRAKPTEVVAAAATTAGGASRSTFLLDSGAGRHMVTGLSSLCDTHDISPMSITYGNGGKCVATQEGKLMMRTSSNTPPLAIGEVLHVPGSKMNLLYIPQLTDKGVTVTFNSSSVTCTLDDEVILTGKRVGNMSVARSVPAESTAAMVAKPKETPELWHKRLGHLGHDNLERLVRDDLVKGINLKPCAFREEKHDVCDPCARGKQQRLPFPERGSSQTTRVLELVHTNICGPITPATKGGKGYFITFLDDFSGYAEIVLLENRGDVSSVITDTLTRMEN